MEAWALSVEAWALSLEAWAHRWRHDRTIGGGMGAVGGGMGACRFEHFVSPPPRRHRIVEFAKRTREIGRAMVCVEAARVRENPHQGMAQSFRLRAQVCQRSIEGHTIGGDSDDGDHSRAIASHLCFQFLSPASQLVGGQFRRRHGGSIDEVGDPAADFEQFLLLPWFEEPWRESGGVERRPEAIARPCEVMAGSPGVQAGVDAAEEHIEIRRDDITDRPPGGRLELRPGGPRRIGHAMIVLHVRRVLEEQRFRIESSGG